MAVINYGAGHKRLQSWSSSVDFSLNKLENDLGSIRLGTTKPQGARNV